MKLLGLPNFRALRAARRSLPYALALGMTMRATMLPAAAQEMVDGTRALPSLYAPAGRPESVQNPTRAAVLGDYAEPTRFHVLPPASGLTSPAGSRLHDNVRYCDELLALQATSRELSQAVARLVLDGLERQQELELMRFEQILILDRMTSADDADAMQQLRARLMSVEEAIEALQARTQAELERLMSAKQSVLDMYATYALLVGGNARVQYEAGLSRAVSQLRKKNPSLQIRAAPTRNVVLHVGLVPGLGLDGYLASLPAVLSYQLNGVEVREDTAVRPLDAFPECAEMRLKLSLVGACPIAYPDEFDLEREADLPLLAVTVTYEFPSATSDVEATYNPWQLFLRLGGDQSAVLMLPADALERLRPLVQFAWRRVPASAAEQSHLEQRLLQNILDELLAVVALPRFDGESPSWWWRPEPQLRATLPAIGSERPALRPLTSSSAHGARLEVMREDMAAGQQAQAAAVAARLDQIERELEAMSAPSSTLLPALQTSAAQLTMRALAQPVGASALSEADAQIVGQAVQLARRGADPLCGWARLRCDGLSFVRRAVSLAELQASLDHPRRRGGPSGQVDYLPAASVFQP